jgi:colicin import membrane protein
VDQAQLEIQLKVWKELAISKQLLMRSAAEALKLNPDCNPDELKTALEAAIKKSANADASVVTAQEQARQSVQASEKKITESQKARTVAEGIAADLQLKNEKLNQQIAQERATASKELQAFKEKAAEAEKAIKAINTALADTPDNVLKKMKVLKKEKQDEADAKRNVEAALATVRKEKKEQDDALKELKDNSAKLITQYKDTHALATKLHEQLKPLAGTAEVPALTELDNKLILAIEDPEAFKKEKEEEEKQNAKGNGKGKNR